MGDGEFQKKVKDVRSIINRLYGKYMPRTSATRPIDVHLHKTTGAWNKAKRDYLQRGALTYLNYLNEYFPEKYEKLRKNTGNNRKTMLGVARGASILDGIITKPLAGFYDWGTNRVEVNDSSVNTLAHEMLHAYSYLKDKKGLYSYFNLFVNNETTESFTDHLASEVTNEYLRSVNSRELFTISNYSLKPAQRLVKKFGKEAVLHSYFGGWFKKKGKVCIPSRPIKRPANIFDCKPSGLSALKKELLVGKQTLSAATPSRYGLLNIPSMSRKPLTAKPLVKTDYTIQKGDSLQAIARKLTGNGNRWPELYKHNRNLIGNNPNFIKAGKSLGLPAAWLQGKTPGSRKLGTGSTQNYLVRKGDTLSAIARRFTGDAGRWRDIYRHNRGVIGNNPNLIKPRQTLRLPPAWSQPHRSSFLSTIAKGLR